MDDMDISLLEAIQSSSHGYISRLAFRKSLRENLLPKLRHTKSNIELVRTINLIKNNLDCENSILITLCETLVESVRSNDNKHSIVVLFLTAEYMYKASSIVMWIFEKISTSILCDRKYLDFSKISNIRFITKIVDFLYAFSTTKTWSIANKGNNASILEILELLCNKFIAPISNRNSIEQLVAILIEGSKGSKTVLETKVIDQLAFNILVCLKNLNDSTSAAAFFVQHFLACPAVIYLLSNETLKEIKKGEFYKKSVLSILDSESGNVPTLPSQRRSDVLFLTANLIHLSYIEQKSVQSCCDECIAVITSLLRHCYEYKLISLAAKSGNKWHHSILGWTCERISEDIQGTFERVKHQIALLWSREMVQCFFDSIVVKTLSKQPSNSSQNKVQQNGIFQKLLKKPLLRNLLAFNDSHVDYLPRISSHSLLCQLYQNALITFDYATIDITSGLLSNEQILKRIWEFLNENGSVQESYRKFLSFLARDPTVTHPAFSPLHLFSEVAYSLFSILDDQEMYESCLPFSIGDLKEIAKFTNYFCSLAIWNSLINFEDARANSFFCAVCNLGQILYSRDCRRNFTSAEDFWINDLIKSSTVITEFEQQSRRATSLMLKMPYIIPLKDRIFLFRKLVSTSKAFDDRNISNTTIITVERTRIIEDGYSQLGNLPPEALHGTIRVKFINQQGLDEAGIDQDGVFKEFLELILKKVFNPDLNLFASTSDNKLCPSRTSDIQRNHLELFKFVGRMLAKAVYEGICIDVCLAPIMLASILDKKLCPFNELSTLDPVLYKNLTYVRHYNESSDVSDLGLTFSVNENRLGEIKTIDLIAGGRGIKVTNDNKLAYIHKMAHHLVSKINPQIESFAQGFRSILCREWLSLFSIHELQTLISGQRTNVDLADLKKHTHYYNGLHSNHRLVKWLWSILEQDFTEEERQLFLKFVTSCSRPPLMGFAFLQPQFSIRCVEASEDMDTGDSLGSVIRGFLAINIRKTQHSMRLPTASTCFNLLKLPNYSKRSILLEKLRYAIHADTGFELS